MIFLLDHMPNTELSVPNKELVVRWSRWILGQSRNENPGIDSEGSKCHNEQPPDIWFLAGAFETKRNECVKRKCNVPYGRALFFPLICEIASSAEYPDINPLQLSGKAKEQMNKIFNELNSDNWEITFDESSMVEGKSELERFHVASSIFEIILPENNILHQKAGRYVAVADGLWFVLKPPSGGSHHLHFGTDISSEQGSTLDGEVDYILSIS